MSFPPGSFPWLVAHDLRLSARRFRGLFGKLRWTTMALVTFVAALLFHLLAWPVATWLGTAESGGVPGQLYYPALASATLFIMPWLVSQALTGATRALYSRGDLDLLLASPLSARTILGARALAIAIDSVSSVAIFLLPVADMNVLMGRWPHSTRLSSAQGQRRPPLCSISGIRCPAAAATCCAGTRSRSSSD